MSERDKSLTEAMGDIWHKCDEMAFHCDMCSANIPLSADFSTWAAFGKLWEWAQQKEWWGYFGDFIYSDVTSTHPKLNMTICELEWFINPAHFADAIYKFLKERTP